MLHRISGLLVASVLILALLLSGCAADEAKPANRQHNYYPPYEQTEETDDGQTVVCSSPEEMDSLIGIPLYAPKDASDVTFMVISNKLAQCSFTLDNRSIIVKSMMTASYQLLTGFYGEPEFQETTSYNCIELFIDYIEGGEGKVTWFYPELFLSFAVHQEKASSFDNLEELAVFYIDQFAQYVNHNPADDYDHSQGS